MAKATWRVHTPRSGGLFASAQQLLRPTNSTTTVCSISHEMMETKLETVPFIATVQTDLVVCVLVCRILILPHLNGIIYRYNSSSQCDSLEEDSLKRIFSLFPKVWLLRVGKRGSTILGDCSQVFDACGRLGREKLEGVERLAVLHGLLDLLDDLHAGTGLLLPVYQLVPAAAVSSGAVSSRQLMWKSRWIACGRGAATLYQHHLHIHLINIIVLYVFQCHSPNQAPNSNWYPAKAGTYCCCVPFVQCLPRRTLALGAAGSCGAADSSATAAGAVSGVGAGACEPLAFLSTRRFPRSIQQTSERGVCVLGWDVVFDVRFLGRICIYIYLDFTIAVRGCML